MLFCDSSFKLCDRDFKLGQPCPAPLPLLPLSAHGQAGWLAALFTHSCKPWLGVSKWTGLGRFYLKGDIFQHVLNLTPYGGGFALY